MRWQMGKRSGNVEDRRGSSGGGGLMKLGGGSGCLLAIVAIVMVAMGENPLQLLGMVEGGGGGGATSGPVESSPEEDQQVEFVRAVLGDTEVTWNQVLPQQANVSYREPTLVLFRDSVRSACGYNSAAVGPFYCPPDQKVYIDLSFFDQLAQQFDAPGDFAQAYVIGHEVGHHIQNLTGLSDRVHQARARVGETQGNQLSVRQELQADCYAGVWAHYAHTERQLLEEGDIDEGLRAAAAIGDDTIQRRSQGRVSPESWTHGSSDQRVRWFRTGFQSGNVNSCDTFEGTL